MADSPSKLAIVLLISATIFVGLELRAAASQLGCEGAHRTKLRTRSSFEHKPGVKPCAPIEQESGQTR